MYDLLTFVGDSASEQSEEEETVQDTTNIDSQFVSIV